MLCNKKCTDCQCGFGRLFVIFLCLIPVALIIFWYATDWQPKYDLAHYATPTEKVDYGNFAFDYSKKLVVKNDYIYTTPVGVKGPHTIVLERVVDEDLPAGTKNNNRIEINLEGTSCAEYKKCQEVDGIAIGTNSTDAQFLKYFEQVAKSFRVL